MSMYAVVKTGGKQYRVTAGATLFVEKLDGEPGSTVTFDRVLLVGDDETVMVGTPTVSGASVQGTVVGAVRGPKLVVFKFKQKVKYRRRTGHRQQLTQVRIDSISAEGKTVTAEVARKARPARRTRPKAAARKTEAAEPTGTAEGETPAAEGATPAAKPSRRARTAKPAKPVVEESAAEGTEPAAPKPARTRRRTSSAAKASEPEAADETASAPAEARPRPRRGARAKARPAEEE
jgi:large subunit ribosomal protein L21